MKHILDPIRKLHTRLLTWHVIGQFLILAIAAIVGGLFLGSGVVKADLDRLPLDAIKSPIPLPISITLDCGEGWNPSCHPLAASTAGLALRSYFYIDGFYRGPANYVYPDVCRRYRLANGTHTARVYAVDSHRNSANVGPYRVIKCDRTGPALNLGLRVYYTTVSLAPQARDVWSGVATQELAIDQTVVAWQNYTEVCKDLRLARGAHVVRMRATDVAGNSSAASRAFYCR
jgi:hypothetical protein